MLYSHNMRRVAPWRKSVLLLRRTHVTLPLPAFLCLLLLLSTYLLVHRSCKPLVTKELAHSELRSHGDGLKLCQGAPIQHLSSFDSYIEEQKVLGARQTEIENRFQEIVWDTIEVASDGILLVFPAESDKIWAVQEYGRGLPRDLNAFQKIIERVVHSSDLVYVHTRIDRLRGLQFTGAVRTNDDRVTLISAQQTLGGQCAVRHRAIGMKVRVHVVLPYSKRPERLRLFLENVRALRMQHKSDIVVIICVLSGATEDADVAQRTREIVFGSHGWQGVVVISENLGDVNGRFSRGVALRDAVRQHVVGDEAVVFLCDVDLIVSARFLERCAQNSILRHQVYYPVFYSLFPYGNKHPIVKQFNGFWRMTSFGMACIRKGDFEEVDPFGDAETKFQGWGSEDVHMFHRIRNSSNLVAFRAVEPGLLHRWHAKNCDKASRDYWNCMKTNFVTMGHPLRMGPALVSAFKNESDLYNSVATS